MRRNEFIETLKENLERNGVRDTGDIIEEYEEHFAFKLADGYSEEEIKGKLLEHFWLGAGQEWHIFL